MDCLFCKIRDGEVPADIVYEDDKVIAFKDINPKAPIHILIVPREHIATVNDLQPQHNELIGHLYQVAKQIAQQHDIAERGYRCVFNCNKEGGQLVYHLHMHLLGGQRLGSALA